MNIMTYFKKRNNTQDDTANIAKTRLRLAVGKATLDIDSIVSDLQSAVYQSLAKYTIDESLVKFKHSRKNTKLKLEVAVDC